MLTADLQASRQSAHACEMYSIEVDMETVSAPCSALLLGAYNTIDKAAPLYLSDSRRYISGGWNEHRKPEYIAMNYMAATHLS